MHGRPLITVYASQAHYWRHLAPVADELRARGHDVRACAQRPSQPWGDPLPAHLSPSDLFIVAGWVDARMVQRGRVVYLEHGAGQTYVPAPKDGYAGSPGLQHVRLFLCPSETVAARWRQRYPQAAVEVVGCPALDQHYADDYARGVQQAVGATRPLVAFTSHWACSICPETMPALPLYEQAIRDLQVEIVGHAHPRDTHPAKMWARLGVPFEPDPDVILRTASLLVADNTSLQAEAAACGIPLVFLNRPEYRRDVHHGGRFWEWPEGQVSVDEPAGLADAITWALVDPPAVQSSRAKMVRSIYDHLGGASARAADAIERL